MTDGELMGPPLAHAIYLVSFRLRGLVAHADVGPFPVDGLHLKAACNHAVFARLRKDFTKEEAIAFVRDVRDQRVEYRFGWVPAWHNPAAAPSTEEACSATTSPPASASSSSASAAEPSPRGASGTRSSR